MQLLEMSMMQFYLFWKSRPKIPSTFMSAITATLIYTQVSISMSIMVFPVICGAELLAETISLFIVVITGFSIFLNRSFEMRVTGSSKSELQLGLYPEYLLFSYRNSSEKPNEIVLN